MIIKFIKKTFKGGLDKMTKNIYIYYSGPTDATGKNIAEALKAKHGKKLPPTTQPCTCICWGCKTQENVKIGKLTILNHPDKIRDNRNKFKTLQTLRSAKINVANFVAAGSVMAELDRNTPTIMLPLVGRTNYHQGGKGFWTCLTKGQVKRAMDQGAQYFQNYMDVKTEYRLHIFNGIMINAQKKTERTNMAEAFAEQHAERIKNNAEKKGQKLDNNTMKAILQDLGKRQEHPDQIIKSNTRGWKFSQVKTVRPELEQLAINAIKTVGLDFGAVDCCILEDGNVAIIEVNTGPGLTGSSFDAYIKAMKDYLKPTPAMNKVGPKNTSIRTASAVRTTNKNVDPGTLRHMADMLELADEEESNAINRVFGKMFK